MLSLPPEIIEAPQRLSTVDGKSVTLRCRVFGAPKPRVKWLFNSQPLSGGKYYVNTTGDLVINPVSFQDNGEYSCIAENKFGRVQANGSLEVKEHTRITEAPIDYEVVAGQTATFRCNAVSDSSLDLVIDWTKDNSEIDFERDARFVKQMIIH